MAKDLSKLKSANPGGAGTNPAINASLSSELNVVATPNGAARVTLPDQNGNFNLNVSRSAVKHVQVLDVDMVLQLNDGGNLVLAGGALGAMDDRSRVVFADATQETSRLLDQVGKIPLQHIDKSLILNSDPVGAKEFTDGKNAPDNHFISNHNAAQVNTAATSLLSKIIQDNAGSLTSNGLQNLALPSVAVPPAPPISNGSDAVVKKLAESLPERNGAVLTPIIIGPQAPAMTVNLVNLTSQTQEGSVLYGSGGIPRSALDSSSALQFAPQEITGGDAVRTIYATGKQPLGDFIKVFDINITGDGSVKTLIITGLPSNMTILNATDLGGGRFQITPGSDEKHFALQLKYSTVLPDASNPVHQAFNLTFSATVLTSQGLVPLTDTRHVALKDASSYADLTYTDPATGDNVLVLPAQGTPHIIHAGNGGVTVYGSNANDTIYGGTGADTLIGGNGNTLFEGGAGADTITGGTRGNNTASYAHSATGVTVNLSSGQGTGGDAQGDVLSNIQNLVGSAFNDVFVANASVNRFDGGSGGSDTVSYAASGAAVTVNFITGTGSGGDAQGDTYVRIQNVIGSAYSDLFIANSTPGNFNGGSGGSDTISYAFSNAGVTVDLLNGVGTGGSAQGSTYTHIQNVIGSAYSDSFIANADVNNFDGGSGGSDTVSYAGSGTGVTVNLVSGRGTGGYAEGDTYAHIQNVIGSAYDDVFIANIDSLRFDGGSAGSDTVNYQASTGAITANMITMTGSGGYAQNNTYANIQNIVGSAYNDVFISGSQANLFDGGISTSSSHNRVDYSASNAAVTADLNYTDGTGTSGGYATGDRLVNIQDLTGSRYDDTFVASLAANNFDGGASIAGSHNRVSYASSNAAVTVDLNYTNGTGTSGGYAAGDTLVNIQDLTGSVYDDTFIASTAANRFDGGTSTANSHNRVSYAASDAGVTVDLNCTNGTGTSGGYAAGDTLVNIQDLTGSSFDDTFVANHAVNNFDGGISTASSHNRVSYAASNAGVIVNLNYADGSGTSGGDATGDTLVNIQDLTGSRFDDTFVANLAGNNFDGGVSTASSHNRVNYAASNEGVTVDLNYTNGTGTSGGYAAGDSFVNIQDLTGSTYDDTFVASLAANNFDGGISTASSHNRVSYAASDAAVTVDLNYTNGTGTSGGYATGDTLVNIQDLTGSSFDDLFVASLAANNFDGGVSTASSHNRVSYAGSNAGVTIDLNYTNGTGTSGGSATGDSFTNIQDLTGSVFDDTFVASLAANNFDGGTSAPGAHNRVSYAASDAAVTVDLNYTNGSGTSGGYAAGDTLVNIQDLTGSRFDDSFVASLAANNFDGGTSAPGSHNRVSYAASDAAVTVDLNYTNGSGTGGGYAAGDTLVNIQDLTGSRFDDSFVASLAANNFDGGTSTPGSHNRVSYAASDAGVTVDLNSTNGSGTSGGYAAGDTLVNIQDLTGSRFDDSFVASIAANNFDGGSSNAGSHNRVSYAASDAGVTVDLNSTNGSGTSGGYAAGDTLVNIQDLTGSRFDDTFVASIAANNFDGGTSAPGAHNRVSYAASDAGVTVDLNSTNGSGTSGGYAAGDTLVNIQDLTGSRFDDTFVASLAANNFDGGTSTPGAHNRVSYAASDAGVTVDLNSSNGSGTSGGYADGDTLVNIQDLTGSRFDDIFVASLAANNFDGGTSAPGAHNRVSYAVSNAGVTVDLNSTNGSGTSGGYAAGDTLVNIQDLTGSSFDDTFVASLAANNFDGGSSNASSHNRVSYAASNAGVIVDLNYTNGTGTSGGYAAGDTLVNIQDLTGSSFDDTFVASLSANKFDGGLSTSSSHNRVSYAASDAAVTVDLNYSNGNGTSGGYAAGDTLINIQDLTGSSFDDTFVASAAANKLDGGLSTGSSHNRVSYATSDAGVTVDLNYTNGSGTGGGYATGDTLVNIQDLTGSSFDDTFVANLAANNFDGGASNAGSHNRVSYASSDAAVTVDLNYTNGTGTSGGYAAGDTLVNIQDLTGSSFDDTFVASAAANRFDGGSSNAGSHNRVSYAVSNAGVTVDLNYTNGTGTSGGFATGDTLVNIQDLTGSNFDDTFVASLAANNFDGGAGSNTVSYAGSTAAVTVNLSTGGGAGSGGYAANDTYTNIQNVIGSIYADSLTGASAGISVLTGGAGGDTLNGVAANRSNTYASYAGSANGVTIDINFVDGTGTSGGDAGGDKLNYIDNLIGSSNSDTFIANAQANIFNGGAGGSDTVSYARSDVAVNVDLSNATGAGTSGGYAQGDKFINIQNVIGSQFNDILKGAAGGNSTLTGGAGADDLTGLNSGNYASYNGSAAAVTIDLQNGTGTGGDAQGDVLHNIYNVIGSAGNDTFLASSQSNTFVGNGGTDTVSYIYSNAAVTVDLSATNGSGTTGGYATGDSYNGISNIIGSNYDDTFYASSVANFFDGGAGNNTVSYARSNAPVIVDLYHHSGANATATDSYAKNDTYANIQNVVGSSGNDIFYADANANKFSGGGGVDTVSYKYANFDGTSPNKIIANLNTNLGTGGDANGDTYSAISNLTGSDYVDNDLTGSNGANTLVASGTTNNNVLNGGGASSGTDILDARLGGHNTLIAGAGNNTFMVSAKNSDTIVNQTTGASNIVSANGSGGVTTLHFDDLGSSLDISKFSGVVHGITTLDVSSGSNTNVLIGSKDVKDLGVGNVLTIKITGQESLQIQNSTAEHYRIFANGDYVFYDSASFSNEIARIHIAVV